MHITIRNKEIILNILIALNINKKTFDKKYKTLPSLEMLYSDSGCTVEKCGYINFKCLLKIININS